MKTGIIKYSVTCLTLLFLFAACTEEEEQPPVTVVEPPVEHTDIVLDKELNAYVSWEDFYKKKDISFSLDSFLKTDTVKGELLTVSYNPTDSFYKRFGKLIVYNNDSSMFIDAYSPSWIAEIDKEGTPHIREGEADIEVVVVDTKEEIRTRIYYCGPGCQVQKVFWYNENVVGIMGLWADYADEYYTPTIWYVNIRNGITIPYQYNLSVSIIHANDFMKNHLESKGVKVDY